MSTHTIRASQQFRCATCNSVMHQEHDQAMLSCLRCDVIVRIPADWLKGQQVECEIIPHRSPMLERHG